jgi:hypothetical protein
MITDTTPVCASLANDEPVAYQLPASVYRVTFDVNKGRN